MADLEDDLRRVLSDPAYALPPWPDATQRVRSGMRRRYGRRMLNRLGMAVAAVLATLSAALGPSLVTEDRPAPVPSPSVIAWADLPYANPPPPSVPPRPVQDTCRASDLRLVSVTTDGAGGTLFRTVLVRNDGSAACTIPGRPRLAGVRGRAGGARVENIRIKPTDRDVVVGVVVGVVPATIEPGEAAEAVIETYGGCLDGRSETVYKSVRVAIGDGDIMLPGDLNATCGVGAGPWHRAVTAPDGSLPLLATISAPTTATLGTDLAFLVTLTNPTPAPVVLGFCPNYVIGLTLMIKTGGVHQLNCGATAEHPASIEPGGSVTYAMRLPLPAPSETAQPGTGQLTWSMDGAATASTPITIVAP